eukprot:IDg10790t1
MLIDIRRFSPQDASTVALRAMSGFSDELLEEKNSLKAFPSATRSNGKRLGASVNDGSGTSAQKYNRESFLRFEIAKWHHRARLAGKKEDTYKASVRPLKDKRAAARSHKLLKDKHFLL